MTKMYEWHGGSREQIAAACKTSDRKKHGHETHCMRQRKYVGHQPSCCVALLLLMSLTFLVSISRSAHSPTARARACRPQASTCKWFEHHQHHEQGSSANRCSPSWCDEGAQRLTSPTPCMQYGRMTNSVNARTCCCMRRCMAFHRGQTGAERFQHPPLPIHR